MKLTDIAFGRAEHEDVSIDFLRNSAAWILNGADRFTRAIFEPAVARAYRAQDRGELARELLKIFLCTRGNPAIDQKLEHLAEMATFARLNETTPANHFQTVWNRPGLEHLKPADRARVVLKELGYTSVDAVLRRVRRLVERGWQMTGYRRGTDGRAKQIR